MTAIATWMRVQSTVNRIPHNLYHGIQLAVCVLLGYGMAVGLGLPERFWVVMTVLIVMRADVDSVMGAGWDRVRGTVVGALSGLSGVYLHCWGLNATVATLAIVGVLALASVAVPMLRSASIAALIVMGAGALAGYSAFLVALLRVVQISVGVGVCMGVALLTSQFSTRNRLLAGGATLLGRLGLQLKMSGVRPVPTEAQAEASGIRVRAALQGLSSLAGSADRRFPWSRAQRRPLHERHHRRIAALIARVVQDAAMVSRVLLALRASGHADKAQQTANAASLAIASVAGQLAGKGQAALQELGQLASACERPACAGSALLASPLRILLDDLQQLSGCVSDTTDTRRTAIPDSQRATKSA